jgi:sulfur-carrier protein
MWYTRKMKIRLRYFASIRDIVGQSEELLTMADTATVEDARTLLSERYPTLKPIMERSVNAVNHCYVKAETGLHEGDELVFIPPTGGGC